MMMKMTRLFPSVVAVISLIACTRIQNAAALPPKWHELDESYSFEDYVIDFGKAYDTPHEYQLRQNIFQTNLQHILVHNRRQPSTPMAPKRAKGHVLGVNEWTDTTADELPTGYDKTFKVSSVSREGATTSRTALRSLKLERNELPFEVDAVADLPASVDWRTKGVVTPVKNQGGCGSCWAFASTAVLESHIALQTGVLYELSEQELVSCSENPNHCGGDGGCTGATAEIAFDFVVQNGIVEEWAFGYQEAHGADIECTLLDDKKEDGASSSAFIKGSVASIEGYFTLPSNNYTVVMNTIAKLGPVTVSVACLPWHLYEGGVFYAPMNDPHSADVNHLVVLNGYGTDEETGEDYWLIRNSWGPRWGEGGYIRLRRTDPSTLDDPSTDCGMDVTPGDGVACSKDDSGNDIVPPATQICGTSGILFDTSIPLGGHLL
jgi:cathepsin L